MTAASNLRGGADSSSAVDRPTDVRSPEKARRRTNRLIDKREDRVHKSQRLTQRLAEINAYLPVADKVTDALDQLSKQLFQQLLGVVQEKLTVALQEILEQPIRFRATADFKAGAATVEFSIDRNGNEEDVMKAQGGSVTNVLSVGLRMFALATLDESRHRRFLVLDEQDCWLRPDLVPRLVKMVHDAAQALGFQILMISHHDVDLFNRYADRLYRLSLNPDGSVAVQQVTSSPGEPDTEYAKAPPADDLSRGSPS